MKKLSVFKLCFEQRERLIVFGEELFVHAKAIDTGGAFSILGQPCIPGEWSWAHRHRNEHHFVQVYQGNLCFEIEGSAHNIKTGESLFVPKGTWHRFKAVGNDSAYMYFFNFPGGLENMFYEISQSERNGPLSDEDYRVISAKYGVDIQEPDVASR